MPIVIDDDYEGERPSSRRSSRRRRTEDVEVDDFAGDIMLGPSCSVIRSALLEYQRNGKLGNLSVARQICKTKRWKMEAFLDHTNEVMMSIFGMRIVEGEHPVLPAQLAHAQQQNKRRGGTDKKVPIHFLENGLESEWVQRFLAPHAVTQSVYEPRPSHVMIVLSMVILSHDMISITHLRDHIGQLMDEQEAEKVISKCLQLGYLTKHRLNGIQQDGMQKDVQISLGPKAFQFTSKVEIMKFIAELFGEQLDDVLTNELIT